jgi:hypothetical protein
MNTDQSPASPKTSALDAVDLLKADHQKVKALFEQLDSITKQGASDTEKSALVAKIRDELSVHESVENEVFFPAVRWQNVLRSSFRAPPRKPGMCHGKSRSTYTSIGLRIPCCAQAQVGCPYPAVQRIRRHRPRCVSTVHR